MTNTSNIKSTSIPDKLEHGKNRERVFQDFFTRVNNANDPNNPKNTDYKQTLLYRSVQNSPYKQDINDYPNRLKDQKNLLEALYQPYPLVGELPKISEQGLEFIHSDITEACICVGYLSDGKMKGRWMGRNALKKNQFWSSTKIIPLLNVVSQLNQKSPNVDINSCTFVDPKDANKSASFFNVADDIISYANKIGTSNALAAMCKRFETWEGLELWVKKITGNQDLVFRGRYGEDPYINLPTLSDSKTKNTLLQAAPETNRGDNLVTAYDLVRFISMLGWHHNLPTQSRLPGAQWHSLEPIIKAMGSDPCRYIDLAIEALGLEKVVTSPTIISKLGNGVSDSRHFVEIAYVALVQFLDQRPTVNNNPPVLRTVSMALRGAIPLKEPYKTGETKSEKRKIEEKQIAIKLDARMAAEVTEIMRRLLTEELV